MWNLKNFTNELIYHTETVQRHKKKKNTNLWLLHGNKLLLLLLSRFSHVRLCATP